MTEAKLRYKVACPECGCGLIDGLAPDIWREKYGDSKPGDKIDVSCPHCGKDHSAVVSEETEE